MKLYVFVNDQSPDGLRVVALREDGHMLGDELFRSVALAKEAAKGGIKGHEGPVMWVDAPNDHPGVVSACKLWEAAQEAATETAEDDPPEKDLDPEAVARLKKGHLCDSCAHARVCGVAVSTGLHEQLGGMVVISACLQHHRLPKEEE